METLTITAYTAQELKAEHPDAYKRAFKHHQKTISEHPDLDCVWVDLHKSLGAFLSTMGMKGYYEENSQSCWVTIRDTTENYRCAKDFTGRRAWAWLESNLFSKLRRPWLTANVRLREARLKRMANATEFGEEHAAKFKWGADSWKINGVIPDCPLTGVCYDEDLLDAVRTRIRNGRTIGDAINSIARVMWQTGQDAHEYLTTEEAFLEDADSLEWRFDKYGRMLPDSY